MIKQTSKTFQKNVFVIGAGAWGKALHYVIKQNHPVSLWDKVEDLSSADVLIIAIPIPAIRSFLTHTNIKDHCIIVNTSKGIEKTTNLFPHQIVHKVLNGKQYHYFTLAGPSFAEEVRSDIPTIVNIGYRSQSHSSFIKHLFLTPYFRIRLTKNIELIEMFAAFKNVYAITCGLAMSMGFKENTRAKLIVLALEELYRMMNKLNIKISSSSLPGTVGDLVLTTHSQESRNFRFGKLLAKMTAEQALTEIDTTVEGYNTVFSIDMLCAKLKIKLPLAQLTHTIIASNEPKIAREKLFSFLSEA